MKNIQKAIFVNNRNPLTPAAKQIFNNINNIQFKIFMCLLYQTFYIYIVILRAAPEESILNQQETISILRVGYIEKPKVNL